MSDQRFSACFRRTLLGSLQRSGVPNVASPYSSIDDYLRDQRRRARKRKEAEEKAAAAQNKGLHGGHSYTAAEVEAKSEFSVLDIRHVIRYIEDCCDEDHVSRVGAYEFDFK